MDSPQQQSRREPPVAPQPAADSSAAPPRAGRPRDFVFDALGLAASILLGISSEGFWLVVWIVLGLFWVFSLIRDLRAWRARKASAESSSPTA